MAETRADGVPGTPSIREVRPETGIGSGGDPIPGIRRVNLRAEIDTSPPFGSVKEAVTRFGGSGPWIPLYRLGEAFNNIEDFDLKKVEEQAAELEKDLIVKELETLDVLEELGATKRIVEDLKQQLQKEALKCFATPDVNSYEQVGTPVIKEMNKENYGNIVNNQEHILQSPTPCTMSSPDLILMELKQAKMNLGKTIDELGVIQSSVESLNKKMKKEKIFLERTRQKLASKFASFSAQERAQEQTRLNPPASHVECAFYNPANIMRNFNSDSEQYNRTVETRAEVSKPLPVYDVNGFSIKTAEMRWLAAKKMEEAARAAEAIAFAEIKALSSAERSSGFALPEPEKVTFALAERSPLNPKAQIPEESTLKKVIDSKFQIDETNISKLTILKKLEEATKEVLHSKKVLTDALNSVETANRKQHAVEEALRRWIPEDDLKKQAVYNSISCNKFNQAGNCHDSSLPDLTKSTTANNDPKPVLRSTISMRDVLSRKQVPEGYATRKEMEEHTERQKVALSQMLRALREDITLPTNADKDGSNQKRFVSQRKKFGFIQISLPMTKPNKRRA
ncbi:WEB family protein At2g40480-like [Gastrolobium bilobum]|uniref:WEB family protein At2g40480-like n=1 Tax=Gastrolobium bilobum TaxID=150636 RepID=UPI002AB1A69E|nr:WEB family protein At2g40480-like [Gastrolobium bilobum]